MRTFAVVSGSSGGAADRPPERARWFLARLGELGAVDLLLVHDEASTVTDRRARRQALVPPDVIDRFLEITAPPQVRTGRLREVHLHRSKDAERTEASTVTGRAFATFVAGAPAGYDLHWCGDVSALARSSWAGRPLPAVVDVDAAEDLSTHRSRRAARSWVSAANLVTVADGEVRELLAVPGAAIVDRSEHESFAAAVAGVVADSRAYRPIRTT